MQKAKGVANESIFVKDAFHDAIIAGTNRKKLRARKQGTKFSPVYQLKVKSGETRVIYCRLDKQG
jgi:hypothetical protein